MTLPPCISFSYSARANSGNSANNSNLLLINTLRQQQQQSRLYSTSTMLRQSEPISPIRSFEPRTATPDRLQRAAKESSKPEEDAHFQNKNDEREMEDNAARMLLQLSNIVSKEISSDSGCIARDNSRDMIHKSEESQMEVGMHQSFKRFRTTDRHISSIGMTSPSISIPKSIEIHKNDWEYSYHASTSTNSLKNNGIPHVVFATNPKSFSNLSSQLSSNILSQNSSFERIAPRNGRKRFRTVSIAGDEFIPEERELSPMLVPLSSPLSSKDVSYSYPLNETPPHIPRHLPQLCQHSLVFEKREIEREALRRALLGDGPGAKVLSKVLAASDATAAAAMITPVPEQPRLVLTIPNPSSSNNNASTIGLEGCNMFSDISSMIRGDSGKDRKGSFPLELPPLLMNPKKNTSKPTVGAATRFAKPSKRVASLAAKSTALTRKATTKKNQPVQGPRSKKKDISKKQQRQKLTGKKFSWKAYPELEEFLIDNREEYLSYSARNYTIEQRDYNNRLTSRLLEHAENSGYPTLFENCAFSAVRDRIRSYYKSYVQSFKRRKERQQQQERLKNLEISYQQQDRINKIGMSYM